MDPQRYDAIIAGGGIAGLTSAAYLARAGKRVLLLEKNNEPGGLVNSFERDGFVFDAGVRAILDAGVVNPMLRDLGIRLDFVPGRVSLGIEGRIVHIENLDSIGEYRNLLAELYPGSEEEIDRFIKAMREIMKLLDVLYGIENPLFRDVRNDREYVFKTLLPWLPRYLMAIGKINRLSRPSEDYLREIIRDPSLIDIIAQHFFKDTPTFFALSYFTLYLSYLYPKGGIGALSGALARQILASGGEIRTETKVLEVDPASRSVTDDGGEQHFYKSLIWAADLKTLYGLVKPEDLAPADREAFERSKEGIVRAKPGESIFSLYLETDLPPANFSNISNGHFFFTPSRKGLGGIHKSGLEKLLANWESVDKGEVFSWLDSFLKFNTFEIAIPALRDPDLAPAGKTGLQVSILMEHGFYEKLKARGWEEEFTRETEDRIIRLLGETVYPSLGDKVEKQFSFTPLSFERRTGSSGGAIVGWSFETEIPVVHKMQHVAKSVLTPVPHIYQAGQWAYNPAGLPTCIMTGKLAADRILKETGQ